MTTIPAGIAAQQALTQQAIALETVKKSNEADQAIANLIAEAADSVPTGSRGSVVNITA